MAAIIIIIVISFVHFQEFHQAVGIDIDLNDVPA